MKAKPRAPSRIQVVHDRGLDHAGCLATLSAASGIEFAGVMTPGIKAVEDEDPACRAAKMALEARIAWLKRHVHTEEGTEPAIAGFLLAGAFRAAEDFPAKYHCNLIMESLEGDHPLLLWMRVLVKAKKLMPAG